jgi:hypothetical protein
MQLNTSQHLKHHKRGKQGICAKCVYWTDGAIQSRTLVDHAPRSQASLLSLELSPHLKVEVPKKHLSWEIVTGFVRLPPCCNNHRSSMGKGSGVLVPTRQNAWAA